MPPSPSRTSSRPRVLVIAEAANPEWASVPLVGWSHARALSEVADVHVVTQVRNREAILRAGLTEGREFTAIDSEAVAGPLHRIGGVLRGGTGKGWTTTAAITTLGYSYFERLVWSHFQHRLRAGEFQIVHRITPLSPVTPSLLATRCSRIGVPFILGPLNGGVPWPMQFDSARRAEREWLSYLRGAYKLLPGYRSTLTRSSAVIIGSRDTWKQVPQSLRSRCVYIPENAIDPARFPPPPPRAEVRPLKVAFLGRLVPYKGPDMLLEAAAPLLRDGRISLTFVGDGPVRPALEARIKELGVKDPIRITGWIPQQKIHEHLAEADVMAFPSIREFGGAAALEAMACGAVPMVVDYGGPAELVTPETGYLIPLGTRAQIVERFRTALQSVVDQPGQLAPRRLAGSRRIRTLFTWSAKASQVLAVYEWILGRQAKPDFGMPMREAGAN